MSRRTKVEVVAKPNQKLNLAQFLFHLNKKYGENHYTEISVTRETKSLEQFCKKRPFVNGFSFVALIQQGTEQEFIKNATSAGFLVDSISFDRFW